MLLAWKCTTPCICCTQVKSHARCQICPSLTEESIEANDRNKDT